MSSVLAMIDRSCSHCRRKAKPGFMCTKSQPYISQSTLEMPLPITYHIGFTINVHDKTQLLFSFLVTCLHLVSTLGKRCIYHDSYCSLMSHPMYSKSLSSLLSQLRHGYSAGGESSRQRPLIRFSMVKESLAKDKCRTAFSPLPHLHPLILHLIVQYPHRRHPSSAEALRLPLQASLLLSVPLVSLSPSALTRDSILHHCRPHRPHRPHSHPPIPSNCRFQTRL